MPGTIYKSGTFTVPGSTGNHQVTGVGFQPDGVLFFGSNKDTLDSVVVVANIGAFMGFMAADWDSASIISQCVFCMPNPKSSYIENQPILATETNSSTKDYAATAVSLDGDGFTLNFTDIPASGSRYVHYLAWGESDNAGAHKTWSSNPDETLTLGWRAKSLLSIGSNDDNGDGSNQFTTQHFAWWGANSYPDSGASDFDGVYEVDVSRSQQRVGINYSTVSPPITTENYRGGAIGTILGGELKARPTGGSLTDLIFDYVSSLESWDAHAFWDGNSSAGQVTPSGTTGGETTEPMVNPDVEEVAAVIFFTTGDTDGFGTTLTGNVGFGVATPTHQACVYLDGSAGALFQSDQYGWCCDVAAGGATAGTVELGDEEMVLTTELDDGPAAQNMVYIAFGPFREAFIPQFYRIRKSFERLPA